jgi:hypothetical protein
MMDCALTQRFSDEFWWRDMEKARSPTQAMPRESNVLKK